jgi:hypothetical protein
MPTKQTSSAAHVSDWLEHELILYPADGVVIITRRRRDRHASR